MIVGFLYFLFLLEYVAPTLEMNDFQVMLLACVCYLAVHVYCFVMDQLEWRKITGLFFWGFPISLLSQIFISCLYIFHIYYLFPNFMGLMKSIFGTHISFISMTVSAIIFASYIVFILLIIGHILDKLAESRKNS